MLFADDTIKVYEFREGLIFKVETWREVLKSNRF